MSLFVLLFAPACDRVFFDFGEPVVVEDSSTSDDCDSVQAASHGCEGRADSGACYAESSVHTVALEDGLGCTPGGLAFGALELPSSAGDVPMSLYAWSAPYLIELAPTDVTISQMLEAPALLSVFTDACGEDPIGSEPLCEYRDWLFVSGVEEATSLYLLAQTDSPDTVTLGYQLMASEDWAEPLPDLDDDLSCALAPSGPLSAALILDMPWSGAQVSLDFYAVPPATESNAILCGEQGVGWRQQAFLLRNQADYEIEVTGLALTDGVDGAEVEEFHFGFYGCSAEGAVMGGQAALVESCYDAADHASKTFSYFAPVWKDENPDTEVVLVLQIPPTAGHQLKLAFKIGAADVKGACD